MRYQRSRREAKIIWLETMETNGTNTNEGGRQFQLSKNQARTLAHKSEKRQNIVDIEKQTGEIAQHRRGKNEKAVTRSLWKSDIDMAICFWSRSRHRKHEQHVQLRTLAVDDAGREITFF